MKDAGLAHMGVGRAAGKGKAEEAAAWPSPVPCSRRPSTARAAVLINVTGSMDMGLEEVEQAASLVQDAVHPDALTIFGATFDEELDDEMRVTVIATGFADAEPEPAPPHRRRIRRRRRPSPSTRRRERRRSPPRPRRTAPSRRF